MWVFFVCRIIPQRLLLLPMPCWPYAILAVSRAPFDFLRFHAASPLGIRSAWHRWGCFRYMMGGRAGQAWQLSDITQSSPGVEDEMKKPLRRGADGRVAGMGVMAEGQLSPQLLLPHNRRAPLPGVDISLSQTSSTDRTNHIASRST